VVLDRARADEQPRADLRVRQALAGQPRDLRLLRGQLHGRLDRTLAGGLPRGLQLKPGPFGERPDTHRVQHLVGRAQVLPCLGAAALAAQPLPVQQVTASELGADPGPAEALDRLAIAGLGLGAAEQGTDPGLDPQRPVGGQHLGPFGQPVQGRRDERDVTGPGRCLGQLGYDQGPVPQLVTVERLPGRVACGLGPAQAVVEHRFRVGSEADHPAQTACGRLLQAGLDQLRCLSLPAAPGGEHRRVVGHRRVPCRLGDKAVFFDHQRRRRQVASEQVGSGQVVERELQVQQGARAAGELGLASGQDIPGFGVPQLKGDDLTDSPPGQPEPAAGFVGAEIQGQNQLEGPGQRRGGRRVALHKPQRERLEQDIDRTRRVESGECGPRGLGHLRHPAGDVQVTGPHRGLPESLQVDLTR